MKWMKVDNPALKNRIFGHPDVFEVADFNINMVEGIPNIKCHGQLVHTKDKEAIDLLRRSSNFTLKFQADGENIFRVSVSDAAYRLKAAIKTPGATVVVYRMKGGWGDIIMSFSVAKAMQKQYPDIKIIYSCPSAFRDLVDNDDDVAFRDLNICMREPHNAFVNLTAVCIKYEIAHQPNVGKNRTEIFCSESFVNYKEQFKLTQPVYETEVKWSKNFIVEKKQGKKRPVIGFVPASCAPIRNWGGFGQVAKECKKLYNSINLIFNSDSNYGWNGDKDDELIFGYAMRRVVGLLSQCDLVVGVDTGPMHTASALSVPTIWIFTHIDGNIRTKDYPHATVLQDYKTCPNMPCWYEKPCPDGRVSLCGLAITPKMVMEKIKRVNP
jgi:ADP-heptose:LPS heptosyltransferase